MSILFHTIIKLFLGGIIITDKSFSTYIKDIKNEAIAHKYKYTDDELEITRLDDIKSKSPRIWRLITLAYYRGMISGIKRVKELETTITPSMINVKCFDCGKEFNRSEEDMMIKEYGPVEGITCINCIMNIR